MTKQTRYIDIEGTGVTTGGTFQQTIGLGSSAAYLPYSSTSTQDGEYIYALCDSGNDYITTFKRDTDTGLYRIFSTLAVTPGQIDVNSTVVLVGDYIYLFYDGGVNMACLRFDITAGTPTSSTAMTVPVLAMPGGSFLNAWTDGTDIYLTHSPSGALAYRLTISGTTLTNAGSTATDSVLVKSSGNNIANIFDGTTTYMCMVNTGSTLNIYRLLVADGSSITTTSYTQFGIGNVYSGLTFGAVLAQSPISNVFYAGMTGAVVDSGNTTGYSLMLNPYVKP